MRVPRTFVGCAGRVASEHAARLPAGEAHQVTFGAAAGEPVMGERVPELVRVKLGEPDLGAPVIDHLVSTARCESALCAQPEPWVRRARMRCAGSDVPVNVACGLGPDGEDHLTAALGDDAHT